MRTDTTLLMVCSRPYITKSSLLQTDWQHREKSCPLLPSSPTAAHGEADLDPPPADPPNPNRRASSERWRGWRHWASPPRARASTLDRSVSNFRVLVDHNPI
jgi:hypothetical protein